MASMASGTSVMEVVYSVSASRGRCYGVLQAVESGEAFEMESGRFWSLQKLGGAVLCSTQFARPTSSVEADLTQEVFTEPVANISVQELDPACLFGININMVWWFTVSQRPEFEGGFVSNCPAPLYSRFLTATASTTRLKELLLYQELKIAPSNLNRLTG